MKGKDRTCKRKKKILKDLWQITAQRLNLFFCLVFKILFLGFLNCFGGWKQISLIRNDCFTGLAWGLLTRHDLSAMLPTGHKDDCIWELIIGKVIEAIINALLNYLLITLKWIEMRQLGVHNSNWYLKSQRVNWWAPAALTFCVVSSYWGRDYRAILCNLSFHSTATLREGRYFPQEKKKKYSYFYLTRQPWSQDLATACNPNRKEEESCAFVLPTVDTGTRSAPRKCGMTVSIAEFKIKLWGQVGY